MPELPEVETVKRGLGKLVIGKRIFNVWHDNPKSFPNPMSEVDQFLLGSEITDVRRRAKVLLIDLSSNYSLIIHLKMTGQMVYVASDYRFGAGHPNESLISKLPNSSTRVEITFQDKSKLFFNDQRKFGWMRLMPTPLIDNIDFMKKLGPEPLEDSFTLSIFKKQLMRRKGTTIKAALLDQTVLAGVGNIYADESLWGASVHPATRVNDVPAKSIKKLFEEIRYVLQLSIEKGGSTDRNYVDAEGKKGSYIKFARVFRREGQPCPRCGTTILKTKVAGRGTHLCPVCQVV